MKQPAVLTRVAAALLASAGLSIAAAVDAAEIKVLSLPPLRNAMSELLPRFERSSEHKLTIEYATPGLLLERLQKTDAADVVIMTRQGIAGLQQQGKIAAGSDVDIARVGMGVFVRKGAPNPDIGSTDAFKRTLLAARSIAYIDPASGAPGGIYLAALFERLGIAAELKTKTRNFGPSGAEAAVAAGEIELGLSQMTVIVAFPGVELAGPLPMELQNYLQFTAGIVGDSKHADAAKGLIQFISSPAAAAVMKARGYE